MSELTRADDDLHPPASDDPLWTETSWYAFSVPERGLAGTVYPLFRLNQGVCSIAVSVWDASAHAPWAVPYNRAQWHLPMPAGDLSDFEAGGLRYTCLEPLTRYRVQYDDPPALSLDLEYQGLIAPHVALLAGGHGHVDQPCHVTGTLRLHGEEIRIDGFEMRDRSWHVRDDRRSTRASYSYALRDAGEAFLAMGMESGDVCKLVGGFLLRNEEKADLVAGERRVLERRDGYPLRIAIEAEDRLGRALRAEGRTLSRLANQATPGMFAWMSLAEWRLGGEPVCYGEDQDIWSPDVLAAAAGLR